MMNFPTSVTTFQVHSNLPTSARTSTVAKLSNFSETFQLRSVLSHFNRLFPTSLGSLQLQPNFPTSRSFKLPFPTTRIPKIFLICVSKLTIIEFSRRIEKYLEGIPWNIYYVPEMTRKEQNCRQPDTYQLNFCFQVYSWSHFTDKISPILHVHMSGGNASTCGQTGNTGYTGNIGDILFAGIIFRHARY